MSSSAVRASWVLAFLASSASLALAQRTSVLDVGDAAGAPGSTRGGIAGLSADREDTDAWVQLVFEGFVVDPSGSPAMGAVVVSSAGGKAVTDDLGRYRLEARVPRGADWVQVTAVSSGSNAKTLSASTRVESPAGSRLVRADPLLLIEEATCSPNWLPTFGGQPGVGGEVFALAVFDDGSGPALYAGGGFGAGHGADQGAQALSSAIGRAPEDEPRAPRTHRRAMPAKIEAEGSWNPSSGAH